jgi:hypothetical protein
MKKLFSIFLLLSALMSIHNFAWAQDWQPELIAKLSKLDSERLKKLSDFIKAKKFEDETSWRKEVSRLRKMPLDKNIAHQINELNHKIDELDEQRRTEGLLLTGDLFIKDAPIAFEGTIIEAKQYLTPDSSELRHATLIKITKVLKGKQYIKEGLIELQTEAEPSFRSGKKI